MKRDGHGDLDYEIWGNQVQMKHLEIQKKAKENKRPYNKNINVMAW